MRVGIASCMIDDVPHASARRCQCMYYARWLISACVGAPTSVRRRALHGPQFFFFFLWWMTLERGELYLVIASSKERRR